MGFYLNKVLITTICLKRWAKKKSSSKKNGINKIIKKQMKMKSKKEQKKKNKIKNEEILKKFKQVNAQNQITLMEGAASKKEKKKMKLKQQMTFVSKMEV